MSLTCRQFNSAREPMRIAFMGGRLMHLVPFEGRDKYQDGHGHMLVKAIGLFAVVDEKSRKMDESGLVTVLAEAMLLPTYALQSYIRWEDLDSTRAKAVLSWNGVSVSGVFEFGETGECLRFESHDRWQQGADSASIPWSAYFRKYREQDGIRFASETRTICPCECQFVVKRGDPTGKHRCGGGTNLHPPYGRKYLSVEACALLS